MLVKHIGGTELGLFDVEIRVLNIDDDVKVAVAREIKFIWRAYPLESALSMESNWIRHLQFLQNVCPPDHFNGVTWFASQCTRTLKQRSTKS